MKESIEKAASEYAENRLYALLDSLSTNSWPDVQDFLKQSYLDGANFALSQMWVKPEIQLPRDRQRIVFAYQSYHHGRYLTLYDTERYDAEKVFMSGAIKQNSVVAWLPLPDLY